jgi:hypothetical protein
MTHENIPPTSNATKRVRICLSAMMRADWSAVVEVPTDASEQELIELSVDFNRDIDGGEYVDDNEYWENNDARVAHDVCPREKVDYLAVRGETGNLVCEKLADRSADPDPSWKTYRVLVRQSEDVVYLVPALNAEAAQHAIEESADADGDFVRETHNTAWYVDNVEEVDD